MVGSIIINNLYKNPQVTWKEIFSSENINLTHNLEYNGNSLASIISHYINNNFTYSNITNYDILFAYDLNDDTFSFSDSLTNYKKINLNLKIGENENLLRYLILALTFTGGLILFGLRYLSFYREYIIIKELGIPFYKSCFC